MPRNDPRPHDDYRAADLVYRTNDDTNRHDDRGRPREHRDYQGQYHGERRPSRSLSPRARRHYDDGEPRVFSQTPGRPLREQSPPRRSGIIRRGSPSGDGDDEIDDDPEHTNMTPDERFKILMKTIRDNKTDKWNIPCVLQPALTPLLTTSL